ncbi:hypothetical protein BV97_05657 [Novosphingobium resinovorum]|uniref:Uncharacterized protein n=1 Tax=Novosphingobium resinovorum TaxID=158500 RepID=A0A031J438_9SPHN|nr:hypothetical protein BV97_05657 [Novosphingobium resinovorum]
MWVDFRQGFATVADDGFGMSLKALRDRYLVIGKSKRTSPKEQSPGGRKPMGRKGIGKLAPFGVARMVDVATVNAGVLNWFTLSLDDLLKMGRDGGEHRYKPVFHAKDVSADLSAAQGATSTATAEVRRFLRRMRKIPLAERSGTLVAMYGLTANALPAPDDIISGLGARFSVVLARPDFKVRVSSRLIDEKRALPAFDFRIPAEGFKEGKVGGRPVKWWAGFVLRADWPADQAGVGVFAHSKIAQDRPFFFGAKGKEIYQRYLYAVVEADWLDELERDLVSTDRTSIDWHDPETAELLEWGRKEVGTWLDRYAEWRATLVQQEVETAASTMRSKGRIHIFSDVENQAIVKLVADASGSLGRGAAADKSREDLLDVVSRAWINQPTRELLRKAWTDLANAADDADAFKSLAETVGDHAVPEAMGLALTFAQRAFALSVLETAIGKKSEARLQKLVEEFPWIIQPRGELLTADQWLKTSIEKIADEDESKDRAGRTIREMSHQERADFVFLTSPSETRIQIVEIKQNDPQHTLNLENRRQLADYLDMVESERSSADVSGLLIGHTGNPRFDAKDSRITVKSWDEILIECRAAYLELLAGTLEQADLGPGDSRLAMVKQFGGPKVWTWLNKMAQKDKRLAAIMEKAKQTGIMITASTAAPAPALPPPTPPAAAEIPPDASAALPANED